MASSLSNTFRIVYFIGFFISFLFVLSIISDELYSIDALSSLVKFLDYFIALIESFVVFLSKDVVIPLTNALYSVFAIGFTIPILNIKLFGSQITPDVSQNINFVAQMIFPNSSIFRQETIGDPVAELLGVYGVFFAVILIPLALISAIGFLTRGEARLAITSFVAMQGLLILASYVPNPLTESGRMILIDLSLPTFGGTISSFFDDLILLMSSQIFIVGLSLYILLELAFQSAYAINVIDPMVDREKRIKKHLDRIDHFRPSKSKTSGSTVSLGSGSATVRKYDMLAASYLREMVDKRIFRRGQNTQDEKTTLRLQSYIQSLRRTDRNFEAKITAVSAQPDTWSIIKNVIPLIIFRVILVVIIAFIILNPLPLLNMLVNNPEVPNSLGLLNFPSLIDSIELTQPEFRTVILFNVVLLIIAFSAVVHFLLVHKPEREEKEIKKVSTLVDFQEIVENIDIEEEDEELGEN
ncbi:MAG: hypothetical protein HeimC3_11650 [Candidatus Heimdallarchaeota archaeon LC_3]|nr:MAG: hypothetical protein HeimC3_11650 [Candidatus Heimdallarchaeota archaeon LC_3]